MAKVHCATRAEPIYAAALRSAVEEAEGVSVADTELEEARLVLRAAASRQEVSKEEISRAEVQLLRDELEEQRGGVLRAMMLAGASAKVARAAGYHLHDLKAAGYVNGLKAAQYTCTELKAAGYLTSEAAQAGFGADEAKAAGYFKTIEEAKAAGYVDDLKAGGFAGPKHAGFTWRRRGRRGTRVRRRVRRDTPGYTCKARDAGFLWKEAEYTWSEAREAGITWSEARGAGYTLAEARQAGCTWAEVKEAGYTCSEAREAGITWSEAREAGGRGETGGVHGGEGGWVHVGGGEGGGGTRGRTGHEEGACLSSSVFHAPSLLCVCGVFGRDAISAPTLVVKAGHSSRECGPNGSAPSTEVCSSHVIRTSSSVIFHCGG